MARPSVPPPPDDVDVAARVAATASDLPYGLLTLWTVDAPVLDFEVRWCNQAAREVFPVASVPERAWLRRDLAALVDPTLAQLAESAHRERRVITGEIDQLTPDGPRRIRCVLLPDDTGSLVMLDDVTEHHRARTDLATAESKLAQLQDWGQVGFWELDIATDEVYWSTQAFRIIGLDENSLHGFLDVVHPDDRELIRHITARARAQAGPYRATHRVHVGDDIRVLQHTMQSVAGDDGRPARLLGLVTDVTTEHALEHRMQRASAQQSIGLLAGGMVHDLNNTFSVVDGHAQLALLAIERGEAVDPIHLEAIIRSVESGRNLTRQLLSLGREQVLSPRRFTPVELLERTAVVARATLGRHRVVELDLEERSVDLIADPGGVERLLVDLVINARDALPEGEGHVRIGLRSLVLAEDAELVSEGTLAPGVYAELSVTDDGCGMDEETLDRVFEPFFSTKPVTDGSGVGLAAANVFARRSGGALVVTSTPGTGTAVSLILPAVTVTAGRKRPRPRRVLVAAADPRRAARLQHGFSAVETQSVVATSLGSAVTVLRTEPIDLVVADATIGVPLEVSPTWRSVSDGATLVVLTDQSSVVRPTGDAAIVVDEPDTDLAAVALATELLAAAPS